MKHNYEYKKIKEVCKKESSNLQQNKIAGLSGDYPVYGAGGIVKNVTFYEQEKPYIGIVKDGAGVGRANIYPAKTSLLGTLQYILPNPDIIIGYLLYCLQGLNLSKFSSGATIPHIYFRDYGECLIPLPPLPVQERIVEELDRLSLILEKKKQQIKELDFLAQSIFYDMFGDPIENEKGWEMKPISEIARFYNGKAHEQAIDEKGEYVLVNSKFISSNGMIKKRTNLQLCPLFINDITMVMSDVPNGKALAKCYLIDKDNIYTLNQRICVFRDYQILPQYLLFALNRNKYFLNFNDGNGQTNLRKNEVEKCPIQMPPLDLQQSFAKKIEAIEKQKELINQSIKEVQLLFDAKMDYYFGD